VRIHFFDARSQFTRGKLMHAGAKHLLVFGERRQDAIAGLIISADGCLRLAHLHLTLRDL